MTSKVTSTSSSSSSSSQFNAYNTLPHWTTAEFVGEVELLLMHAERGIGLSERKKLAASYQSVSTALDSLGMDILRIRAANAAAHKKAQDAIKEAIQKIMHGSSSPKHKALLEKIKKGYEKTLDNLQTQQQKEEREVIYRLFFATKEQRAAFFTLAIQDASICGNPRCVRSGTSVKLLRCTVCKTPYCCGGCQEIDRKQHKKVCSPSKHFLPKLALTASTTATSSSTEALAPISNAFLTALELDCTSAQKIAERTKNNELRSQCERLLKVAQDAKNAMQNRLKSLKETIKDIEKRLSQDMQSLKSYTKAAQQATTEQEGKVQKRWRQLFRLRVRQKQHQLALNNNPSSVEDIIMGDVLFPRFFATRSELESICFPYNNILEAIGEKQRSLQWALGLKSIGLEVRKQSTEQRHSSLKIDEKRYLLNVWSILDSIRQVCNSILKPLSSNSSSSSSSTTSTQATTSALSTSSTSSLSSSSASSTTSTLAPSSSSSSSSSSSTTPTQTTTSSLSTSSTSPLSSSSTSSTTSVSTITPESTKKS